MDGMDYADYLATVKAQEQRDRDRFMGREVVAGTTETVITDGYLVAAYERAMAPGTFKAEVNTVLRTVFEVLDILRTLPPGTGVEFASRIDDT